MKRIYRLPDFHLRCNIWKGVNDIATTPFGPVRATNVPCQLVSRPFTGVAVLKLPAGTDIRSAIVGLPEETFPPGEPFGDVVEVPAGSRQYFIVYNVQNVALGYANEYRAALISPANGPSLLPDPSYQGVYPPTF